MSTLSRAGGPGAIKRALAAALAHHRAGELAEAAAGYRSVLAVDPRHPDANQLLGLVALGRSEWAAAAEHFSEAIRSRPKVAEYRSNHGHALRALGDLDGAARELETAVGLDPALADGWINLGLTRLDRGEVAGAIVALETAVSRAPDSALARLNLGSALQRAGRLEEALAAFQGAAAIEPTLAAAHRNAGIVAQLLGRLAEAETCYRRALALVQGDPDILSNLGVALTRQGRLDAAIATLDDAVAADPRLADGWLNRGTALHAAGRLADAERSFREAIARDPGPRPRTALGSVLAESGDLDGAVEAHRAAIARDPDFADGHWNLALALLAQGRIEEGLAEYEWRWRASNKSAELRRYPWPLWGGEPVAGRRVLVWREQGLGDELLFLTCLRDLVGAGAEVTLLATPRLVTLLSRAFPTVTVLPDQPTAAAEAGSFDWHVPVGSLPSRFRRTLADFGAESRYLVPESSRLAHWRARLEPADRPRVGICWRSGLRGVDRVRHYPDLDAWAPLWSIPGLTWVNLQYDDCEAELERIEAAGGPRILRWAGDDLRDDLESVTALLGSLDLVVTAPTAVSSLAGALGVETWQIDSGNDWTLLGESRSPWFPTIRSFRRGAAESSWTAVMERMAAELGRWASDRRNR